MIEMISPGRVKYGDLLRRCKMRDWDDPAVADLADADRRPHAALIERPDPVRAWNNRSARAAVIAHCLLFFVHPLNAHHTASATGS